MEIIDISVVDWPVVPQLLMDESQNFFGHYRTDHLVWEGCYFHGYRNGQYPVPAIPLQVVYPFNGEGYKDMIYIDDVSDPDDPIMVCAWDFHEGPFGERSACIGKRGEYTPTDRRRW